MKKNHRLNDPAGPRGSELFFNSSPPPAWTPIYSRHPCDRPDGMHPAPIASEATRLPIIHRRRFSPVSRTFCDLTVLISKSEP